MKTAEKGVEKKKVCICLGSSCYSRGNSRLLSELSGHGNTEASDYEITGSLCMGNCSCGPNVQIDGKDYSGLDEESMLELLKGGDAL